VGQRNLTRLRKRSKPHLRRTRATRWRSSTLGACVCSVSARIRTRAHPYVRASVDVAQRCVRRKTCVCAPSITEELAPGGGTGCRMAYCRRKQGCKRHAASGPLSTI
jgi:hypothetical protein